MSDNKFRYSHDNCPVCNQLFQGDDDIVVCPVCGTPHHRECYKQNGFCSNADKHSEDFRWETSAPQTDSMAPQEQINNDEKMGLPKFDLGGQALPFPVEIPNQNPLKNFPPELEEGVPTEDVALFVQQDTTRYIQKFFYIKGGKNKWSWAAMFFAPYWFFYRKLYKHGAIIMALVLCLSLLSFLPPVERLMTDMTEYQAELEALTEQNLSEEELVNAFNELSVKAQEAISNNMVGSAIIMGQSLSSALLSLFIGLNANKWYYKHIVKSIKGIRAKESSREAIQQQILKTGGIGFGATGLAILVEKAVILGFEMILMNFLH